MKDATTEMIPFASLRPCAFAFKSRTQRTKIAVYGGVEYNMQPMLHPDLFENRKQDLPSEVAEANTGYVKIFKYVPGAGSQEPQLPMAQSRSSRRT